MQGNKGDKISESRPGWIPLAGMLKGLQTQENKIPIQTGWQTTLSQKQRKVHPTISFILTDAELSDSNWVRPDHGEQYSMKCPVWPIRSQEHAQNGRCDIFWSAHQSHVEWSPFTAMQSLLPFCTTSTHACIWYTTSTPTCILCTTSTPTYIPCATSTSTCIPCTISTSTCLPCTTSTPACMLGGHSTQDGTPSPLLVLYYETESHRYPC